MKLTKTLKVNRAHTYCSGGAWSSQLWLPQHFIIDTTTPHYVVIWAFYVLLFTLSITLRAAAADGQLETPGAVVGSP